MSVLAAFAVPHPPLIVPEVGQGEEKGIQKTIDAYEEVMREAAELRPDTIVLTSPHALMYADYFHISPGKEAAGSLAQFRAPQVEIKARYDTEFVDGLVQEAGAAGLAAGTLGARKPELDHATLIPLYFLDKFLKDYKLVRIGLSGLPSLSHYQLGECVAAVAEKLGRRVVFLASGDLSHKLKEDGPYGFAAEGPVFDKACTAALAQADFRRLLTLDENTCQKAAECGLRSFWIMAGALDRKAVDSRLLSYEGPFGVGYGVASFKVKSEDGKRAFRLQLENEEKERLAKQKEQEDCWVKLARRSIEHYVKTGQYAALPQELPDEMKQPAGAFVSLHKAGQLRGCIGTIEPRQDNVAKEIFYNAISAAIHDPRFSPVMPDELPALEYSVDVLGQPEAILSQSELEVHRYGVIVENGTRRGLLLPDLDGVDTVDEQVDIARRKANIGLGEPLKLYRFEVTRHR
jgi:AmmeMemoRadiSam system protein A/AmmeMemoRadiSam system protein B